MCISTAMAQKAGSSVGAGFGPALGFSSGVHSVDVVDADVACGRRDVRVCALGLPQLLHHECYRLVDTIECPISAQNSFGLVIDRR